MLLAAGAALAQTGTPEGVAERYLAHMYAGEWEEAAKLLDREALARFAAFANSILAQDPSGVLASALFGGQWAAEGGGDLAPEELFAKFLSRGYMAASSAVGPLVIDGLEVLGSVREGDDLAHVVVRSWTVVDGVRASTVEAISLRRGAGGWGVLLSSDVEAMMQIYRSMISGM